MKESTSFLARTQNVDDDALVDEMPKPIGQAVESGDLSKRSDGIPIRR